MNCKLDINKPWPRYVPPQHLSFAKKEGVSERPGEGHIQRNTKKCHEINSISTLALPNNSLQNAMKVGDFSNEALNNLTLELTEQRRR